ncbi:MAG TPA: glycoside hydrolase family 9 protein [Clostridia bacterium]
MIRKRLLSLGVATCMTASLFASVSSVSAYTDPPKKVVGYTTKGELVRKTDFKDGAGLPWTTVESAPGKASFELSGGTYNITIDNVGANKWDVQFRHRGIHIELNHKYTFKFTVSASKACSTYAKVGDQDLPYFEFWSNNWSNVNVDTTPKTTTATFTGTKDQPVAEIAFHIGNGCSTVGTVYKFQDVSLTDDQFPGYPIYETPAPSDIRVNQVGYLKNGEKQATYVTSSTSPVPWQLKDSSGTVVASGTTKPFGNDPDSGDSVQIIDFSSYKPTTDGSDYTLTCGTATSYKFQISDKTYSTMKYEALKYFYHNRSGIDITTPYCEDDMWARKGGHMQDMVTPTDGGAAFDITGGWYDAGDHGKYVVNGGISVWTLMNQYERAKIKGVSPISKINAEAAYADGTMNIPESKDSKPDLLNEARWEMEMLLKMQIKSGSKAGLAYHKAHDYKWTGLAVMPADDPMAYPKATGAEGRIAKPPSTAATLNLAASAAQSARLWSTLDPTFSKTCLDAAQSAWTAAVANPKLFAPMDDNIGGGPYGDTFVDDDFYWAACELYVTTGDSKYLDYIKSSQFYLKMPTSLTGGEDKGLDGAFDWGNTSGLGTATLALCDSNLPAADKAKARASIIAAADNFLKIEASQGYGVSISSKPLDGGITGFPWGSNSFVMNNAIVMGYAYDYSGDVKYANGLLTSLDYLLGRNPNQQCYITRFGTVPLQNPHHRTYSYQTNNTFPKAPPAFVSGGPNSGLNDPWVKGAGWKPGGFPAEKCFMDNIESWSTNEVTINWNAPLAWITGFADEVASELGKGSVVTPTPGGLKGDLNDDGKKNSTDYSILKRVILGTWTGSYNKDNADMNSDGKINSTDLSLLKRDILAGK